MQNDKKSERYFTTGEFAKLCNVKKQTLFHYDHIGVLKPEITGSNGYRYYSHMQLDTYHTISMLKELGMPLAQIKSYLNTRTPDSFLTLLKEQEKQAEAKLKDLQWLKTFISDLARITEEGISAEEDKVFLEEKPQEHYIITEYTGGPEERSINTALAEHLTFCQQNQIYSSHHIGCLVAVDSDFSSGDYNYSHFYTKVDGSEIVTSAHITTIPPRTYAVMYSTRGYDPVISIFRRLLAFAEENGYVPGKYFYEYTLLDEMSRFSYSDYTLKISLPISR